MKPLDLKRMTESTVSHYDQKAEAFWQGTKDHDVCQNRSALLEACLNNGEPRQLTILDFGCGPGRDLIYFAEQGHTAVGLDGSEELAKLARKHSGCQVWVQDFIELDLPANHFDGIFANASLFHAPKVKLPLVLERLHGALKTNGVLFSSNPRGNEEGFYDLRYGNYMELDACEAIWKQAGFEIESHYYRPAGKPRHEQPWLAMVARKR